MIQETLNSAPDQPDLLHAAQYSLATECQNGSDFYYALHFLRGIGYHYRESHEALLSVPYEILVVCNENQGRSQVEEKFLEELCGVLEIPISIRSVGVNATPEKYTGKPSPLIVKKLKMAGFSMKNATVDQLQEGDIHANTILLVLSDLKDLPDFVFNAKVVLGVFLKDPFPGSVPPENVNELLDEMIFENANLALSVVIKLYEAIQNSDLSIFTDYFRKNIITRPDGSHTKAGKTEFSAEKHESG